jgi:hypothetical protein
LAQNTVKAVKTVPNSQGPTFHKFLRERPLFTPEGGINLSVLYAVCPWLGFAESSSRESNFRAAESKGRFLFRVGFYAVKVQ